MDIVNIPKTCHKGVRDYFFLSKVSWSVRKQQLIRSSLALSSVEYLESQINSGGKHVAIKEHNKARNNGSK